MSDSFLKISSGITLKSLSSAPSDPQAGDIYYNSTLGAFQHYNGSDWQTYIPSDGSVALSDNLDAGGHLLTNLADPVSSQDAVTKYYADAIAAGLTPKLSVATATTSPISDADYDNGASGVGATLIETSNGAFPNLDGSYSPQLNDRILVKDQTDKSQNGVYILTALGDAGNPWSLTRSADFDNSPSGEVGGGDNVYVLNGDTNGGTAWVLISPNPVVMGTTNLVWSQNAVSQGDFLADGSVPMTGALDMGSNLIHNVTDPASAQDAATKYYVDSNTTTKAEITAVMLLNGTQAMTAAMEMGGNLIRNVTDPTDVQDAATKGYVDTAITTNNSDVMLTNGTNAMTAILNMGTFKISNLEDPASAQDAATMSYVDTGLGGKLSLSGGSMTGAINCNGAEYITNLADPTSDQNAATKLYVDTAISGVSGFTAALERYVDPTNGNDGNAGTAGAPWATVTYALTQITDASTTNLYNLYCAPGIYGEGGATTISLKAYINIIGPRGATGNSFSDNAAWDGQAIFDGITLAIPGAGGNRLFVLENITFDTLAADAGGSSIAVLVRNCTVITDLNTGIHTNKLSVENTLVYGNLTCTGINPGSLVVYIRDSMVEGDTTFGNAGAGHGGPLVFAHNSSFQGINLGFSTCQITFKSCTCVGFTNTNTGIHPRINLDSTLPLDQNGDPSQTTFSPNTGGSFFINHTEGQVSTTISSSTTLVGDYDTIAVDASAGAVVITLMQSDHYNYKTLEITRVDTVSANSVTINASGGDTINGTLTTIDLPVGTNIGLNSDLNSGTNWFLVVGPSLPIAGGTMNGAIDMNTNYIHGLGDPSSAQDAATKNYVDTTTVAKSPTNTVSLTDNATTDIITVAKASVTALFLYYSVSRNGVIEVGTLNVACDGTNAFVSGTSATTGTVGATYSAAVSGANLIVSVTLTSTGDAASLKYTTAQWLA